MVYDSWDDYMWFILGASLTSSKILWTGDGESNKHLKTSVSVNGDVASIGYTTTTDSGGETM